MHRIPEGFQVSAVSAAVKAPGRLDLALIVSESAAAAAAMFTQNTFIAAPLIVSKRHLERAPGRVRALVVNSGNANAATGDAGIADAIQTAAAAAKVIGCAPHEVLVSSTGVIGRPLPVDRICSAMPELWAARQTSDVSPLAQAIMTTDTFPKVASTEIDGVWITGVAKGAGMIHPDMATMLAFVMTDADIDAAGLERITRSVTGRTFNCISVDGDTSTNDMVVVLANGRSGRRPDAAAFERGLETVCRELAQAIARDGEGATKFVEIRVTGAPDDASARVIGRTIARSPLVKTAIYGADPNFGRIIGAIGNSGIALASLDVDLAIGDIPIRPDTLESASAALRHKDIVLHVQLHCGSGHATIWTCDMTEDYIHINADYTT